MDIKTVPSLSVFDRASRQEASSAPMTMQKEVASRGSELSRSTDVREQQESEQSRQSVDAAVSTLNDFVKSIQRDLDFTVDDGSGSLVVRVTDRISGEVIRQIPSEDALRLAESLDVMRSLLFEEKA